MGIELVARYYGNSLITLHGWWGFFFGYGWVMGLDYRKDYPMLPTFDFHAVGYLLIALVYIAFAFIK